MRAGSGSWRQGYRPDAPPARAAAAPSQGSRSRGSDVASIGPLFRDLRRCLRLSIPEVARKLQTRIDTIEALERGDVRRLPAWPETVRIVSTYTGLAQIDPRSVLDVISAELSAKKNANGNAKAAAGKRMWAASKIRAEANKFVQSVTAFMSKPVEKLRPVTFWFTIPEAARRPLQTARASSASTRLALVCAVLAALLTSLFQSPMLQASATGGAVGRMIGELHEYVLMQTSPKKDGMVWIEVTDPRARRSDKLHAGQQ